MQPLQEITVLDLFCGNRAILVLMKKCPICGRDVVSKRKDAKYCKDSACRKKAHLSRKEQGETAPLRLAQNKAAVVLSFPDGSRWLMELTPLHPANAARLPSLTQVDTAIHEIDSGSDPAPAEPAAEVSPQLSSAGAEISSEQIQPAATTAPTVAPEPTSASGLPESLNVGAAEASPSTSARAPGPSLPHAGLRTIELFFTDERDCRLSFHDAVQNRGSDGWRIRRHATARLGFSRSEGFGLGGAPGRWHDFYPHKSPSDFGLDSDLAVLYRDGAEGQVYVVDPELLRELLEAGWRTGLREMADGRQGGMRR